MTKSCKTLRLLLNYAIILYITIKIWEYSYENKYNKNNRIPWDLFEAR